MPASKVVVKIIRATRELSEVRALIEPDQCQIHKACLKQAGHKGVCLHGLDGGGWHVIPSKYRHYL